MATLLMVGLSWPLWLDGDDFPRVPFLEGWRGLPPLASWSVLGAIVATLALAAIGRAWRPMMAMSVALLASSILGDQNRLQPWAYQYAMIGLVLVGFAERAALRLARYYSISLYLYSGLSKLDVSFVQELGPTFLAAGLSPLGFAPEGWPVAARTAAILAMPAGEVAIAIGLACSSTRRFALIGAVGLHATLLLILGPWGLGHSPNVLVWNCAMIGQDILLFGAGRRPVGDDRGEDRLGPAGRLLAFFFFAFPLGERLGLADSWPAHALYASHCERTEVFVHEGDLDRFPVAVRRRVAGEGEGPWRRLDLTGWSRDVRGTPLYPQSRVGGGVAEALAARIDGIPPVRVIQWGRADPWDGRRESVQCFGLRAIRRRGDRYAINAHPVGFGSP